MLRNEVAMKPPAGGTPTLDPQGSLAVRLRISLNAPKTTAWRFDRLSLSGIVPMGSGIINNVHQLQAVLSLEFVHIEGGERFPQPRRIFEEDIESIAVGCRMRGFVFQRARQGAVL